MNCSSPTIGLYSTCLNHTIETMALQLAESGAQISIIAPFDQKQPGTEHEHSTKRLKESRYRLFDWHSKPVTLDQLHFFLPLAKRAWHREIATWSKQASLFGIITTSTYQNGWGRNLKEIILGFPATLLAHSATILASPDTRHPYPHIRDIRRYVPNAHPIILTNKKLRSQLFSSVNVTLPRPYHLSFIGNGSPEYRTKILNEVETEICSHGQTKNTLITRLDRCNLPLPPEDYIEILGQTNFSLCPGGWSRWSHRVIESLARGAVPILSDPGRYHCGLQDGVNCLVVKNEQWGEAARRALRMHPECTSKMAVAAREISNTHLTPLAASTKLGYQFGLLPSQA